MTVEQKSEISKIPQAQRQLCKFEEKILLELAGINPASPWGAAVGAALGSLADKQLLTPQCRLTSAGQQYIKEHLQGKENELAKF